MWQYLLKVGITAVVVVAVSEVAKRSSLWAAALASLPLTSLLAFVWIYLESGSTERVAALSQGVFWLVLPSLPLFLLLPLFLRWGTNFWLSLALSCAFTALAYATMVWSLGKVGVRL